MNNPAQETNSLNMEARKMNGFMNETTDMRFAWTEADYLPMLEHQLDARLMDDLVRIYPKAVKILKEHTTSTFGDLIFCPTPSIPVLRKVKDFAKQLYENANLAYPEDVAIFLYYSVIVAAELHARTAISELPRTEVLRGYRWSRDRLWAPPKLKSLFEEALAQEHN